MEQFVDISAWSEFRVCGLFENYHGSRLTVAERIDGNIPFLTAGFENQGVVGYVGNAVETYHNPITVDMFGNCFCHEGEYAGDDNVYFFVNDMLSECSKLFVTCVIAKKLAGLYSYNRQFRQGDVDDLCVKLPATSDGEPDWDYMEQYMKAVMDRQAHVIDSLTRISKEKHPVDVSAWGEFRVGELFENYHGSRLTVAERLDGDIPFLTAGFENQGVAGYVGNVVETYHNPITVDMFGNCFYHAGNHAGDDNVYFFVNDTISEFSKLFVTSVIAKKLTGLYSYNCQFRQGDVDDLCVRLPVTPGGEPDWSYMEQYMRAVMDRQEHVVRCLTRLRG